LPSPRVRVRVARPRFGCRKSPRASARSKRAIRSFPVFFVRPLRILFIRKEGCLSRLLSPRVRVWVVGSRLGCRKSPQASAQSKRVIRSFPVFFVRPSRILFVRKEGCLSHLPSPRVRVWVVGSRLRCRKSPRASARSKRAIRSFPVFFVWLSRILFIQKEGWSMPGYPQWVRAVTPPVSCY